MSRFKKNPQELTFKTQDFIRESIFQVKPPKFQKFNLPRQSVRITQHKG